MSQPQKKSEANEKVPHSVYTVEHELASDKNQSFCKEDRDLLLILCCFHIGTYAPHVRFMICTVFIFAFYILYGYFQELIFKLDGFKPFGMYLTLVQFIMYTLCSGIETFVQKGMSRKVPLQMYAFLAFLTVGTMGLSNSSVGYLNYPTQVVFKSCKLIPVLIGGILIQGKKYGVLDFVAAGLMSAGLALFVLTDSQVSANYSFLGFLMISGALISDAIIGNVQEKVMKKYFASSVEMVLYSYSIGAVYIFVVLLLTGQLGPSISFFSKNPIETYGYGAIFSVTGYFGVQMVLTLVKTSGAFAAVTVTTCRKAVTIVLSFLLFAKPFSSQYIWSGLIIVTGIYLNVYSKKHKSLPFLTWFSALSQKKSKILESV